MMAFNSGPILQFGDLPTAVAYHARATTAGGLAFAAAAGASAASRTGALGIPLFAQQPVVPMQELERRAIRHALEHTRGDRTVAAQLLGIGRTTLYRKLKEFEMA
jgi:two-component system response regulator HydG